MTSINLSCGIQTIRRGERIAKMVIANDAQVPWKEVEELLERMNVPQ